MEAMATTAAQKPRKRRLPKMSPADLRLWRKFQARRSAANRNALVERYLDIPKRHAKRLATQVPPAIEFGDLESAGVFGLMDAIDAFELSRGIKFETYCVRRVRGAMLDALRAQDWIPRLERSRTRRINTADESLRIKLGRHPTVKEIAAECGMTEAEVERRTATNQPGFVSLSKDMYDGEGGGSCDRAEFVNPIHRCDLLADQTAEQPTDRIHSSDILRVVTRGLSDTERLLIIGYYYQHHTMQRIGSDLGLSESRVSQLHTALIERLGKRLRPRREEFAPLGRVA